MAQKPEVWRVLAELPARVDPRHVIRYGGTERPRKRGVCTSGRGLTNAYEERRL